MVFYVSEGGCDAVLSDDRIGQLLHQVPPSLCNHCLLAAAACCLQSPVHRVTRPEDRRSRSWTPSARATKSSLCRPMRREVSAEQVSLCLCMFAFVHLSTWLICSQEF
jgi:hypothetical protein